MGVVSKNLQTHLKTTTVVLSIIGDYVCKSMSTACPHSDDDKLIKNSEVIERSRDI